MSSSSRKAEELAEAAIAGEVKVEDNKKTDSAPSLLLSLILTDYMTADNKKPKPANQS